MLATVAQVLTALERRNPVSLAADWDAVGLICGDPGAEVARVLFAVDPLQAVIDEAISSGCAMVITHHPLFLRGVHGVAAVDAKGRIVQSLISHGIALAAAHTNADHASPGVSDALADALGLLDLHPLDSETGAGRIGALPSALTLAQFSDQVAAGLPASHHGVRIAGDPSTMVRTVAVCGGAGDSLLSSVGTRADVYVTADLRHHRAQDHLADGGCALIDVAHWASEWPWLQLAARLLAEDLEQEGMTITTEVSALPTDPWTAHRTSARLGSER